MTNIYDNAIEYIHEHGWARGKFQNEKGEVCIAGAINRSALQLYGTRINESEFDLISYILEREFGNQYWGSITNWNDHLAKDVDEVIGVLKLASEEYELATGSD
jgi:hypothetical protein